VLLPCKRKTTAKCLLPSLSALFVTTYERAYTRTTYRGRRTAFSPQRRHGSTGRIATMADVASVAGQHLPALPPTDIGHARLSPAEPEASRRSGFLGPASNCACEYGQGLPLHFGGRRHAAGVLLGAVSLSENLGFIRSKVPGTHFC
jgi:hypothetical protein